MTDAGKSHSWLRPTRLRSAPTRHAISVALGIRETTRSSSGDTPAGMTAGAGRAPAGATVHAISDCLWIFLERQTTAASTTAAIVFPQSGESVDKDWRCFSPVLAAEPKRPSLPSLVS